MRCAPTFIRKETMMDTPDEWPKEWIEMAWAARDASAQAMNALRRTRFDQIKRAMHSALERVRGTLRPPATR